jgi:hypothetical protein
MSFYFNRSFPYSGTWNRSRRELVSFLTPRFSSPGLTRLFIKSATTTAFSEASITACSHSS